jgi:uncharacterized spore protein YtfJ
MNNEEKTMTQTSHDTDVFAGLREIVNSADAGKVFAAPITQDGTIVLPVAKIGGGGGGGAGTGPADEGGTGGGFGISAKPLGVYVLRDGKVKWLPAVDINKIVLGGQVVAVAALLLARALLRARSEPRRRRPGAKLAGLRLARPARRH